MTDDPFCIVPGTPLRVAVDRLNNLLTGIAIKSGLVQRLLTDDRLHADLKELETWSLEAVDILRQISVA